MITAIQPYSLRTNRSKPIQNIRNNQVSFQRTLPKISEGNLALFKKLTDLMNCISDKFGNSKSFLSNDHIDIDYDSRSRIHLGFNDKSKKIMLFKHNENDRVYIRVIDKDKNIHNNYSKEKGEAGIDETFIINDGKDNFGEIYTYMNEYKWQSGLSDYGVDMTGKHMKPEFVNQFNERINKYLPEITNRVDDFKKLIGIQ